MSFPRSTNNHSPGADEQLCIIVFGSPSIAFLAKPLWHSVAIEARPVRAKFVGVAGTGAAVIGARVGVDVVGWPVVGDAVGNGVVGEREGALVGLEVGSAVVGEREGELVGPVVGLSLGTRTMPQSLIENSLFSALSMIILAFHTKLVS